MTDTKRYDEWGALQRYAEQVLTRRGLPRIKLELSCNEDGRPCGIRPVGGQLTIPTLRHQLDRLTEQRVHDIGISAFQRVHARRIRKEVSAMLHRVEAAAPSMAMEIKTPSLQKGRPSLSRKFTLTGVTPFLEAAGGATPALERIWFQFLDEVHKQLALDVVGIARVCRKVVPPCSGAGVWRTLRVYRTPRFEVEVKTYTTQHDFINEDRLSSWPAERLVDDVNGIAEGRKELRTLSCVITRRDSGEGVGDALIFAGTDVAGDHSRERRVVSKAIRHIRNYDGGHDGIRPLPSDSATAG